jgi:hypothetical protein
MYSGKTPEALEHMERAVAGLSLVFALLFSAAAGLLLVNSATANFIYLSTITIKSYGNIEPPTEFINQTEDPYEG